MKSNTRVVGVAFSVLLLWITPLWGADMVRVFVNNDESYAYLEKGNEKAKFKLRWGWGYEVPGEQIEDKRDWVYIESPVTFKKPRSFVLNGEEQLVRTVERYWVRRDDLVLDSQFNKVEANWPIRYIFFDSGDLIEQIIFSPNGGAKILTRENGYEPVWQKGHVFIANGVIEVRYPPPKYEWTYMEAGYDAVQQKLYPTSGSRDWFLVEGRFTDPREPVIGPMGECLLDCDKRQ